MNILNTSFGEFTLSCPQDQRNSLQAWNQADIYLLNEFKKLGFESCNLFILNDTFGTLATTLSTFEPTVVTDSATSRHWIRTNLEQNRLEPATIINPDEKLLVDDNFPIVFLLKAPKNLDYYRYQLAFIANQKPDIVLIGGMQKHLSKAYFELVSEFFADVSFLPGIKKAKCLIAREPLPQVLSHVTTKQYTYNDITLINYPNVFSSDNLDIGSRFFIENMGIMEKGPTILDLGCGNGALGISMLKHFPEVTHGTFVDESYFATQSVTDSLNASGIEHTRFTVFQSHDISNLEQRPIPFDTILCNPPFHLEHLVTDKIAKQMMKNASLYLKDGGKMYLIGNRHLQYNKLLKRYFKQVKILNKNAKFIIYEASRD